MKETTVALLHDLIRAVQKPDRLRHERRLSFEATTGGEASFLMTQRDAESSALPTSGYLPGKKTLEIGQNLRLQKNHKPLCAFGNGC